MKKNNKKKNIRYVKSFIVLYPDNQWILLKIFYTIYYFLIHYDKYTPFKAHGM